MKPQPNRDPYDTQSIWQMDHDHFVHPWADFASFEKDGCLVISDAEGAYIYDTDGKRYLDGIGGLWCVNIGYGREEMAEAIADQVRQLPYFNPFTDTTNPPAAKLARKLAELAPGTLNRVLYSSGGSTANESAIRLIHNYNNRRGIPGKKHIITRAEAYHGSTYLTMSLDGKKSDRIGFDYITDWIHHVSSPNSYRRPEGMSVEEFGDHLVEELRNKILEVGPENVACFIAEPVLGAGGVVVPPPGYHHRTWEVCREYDVVYISDEVVTAFGRLGHMFASEDMFGICPDIITCAKGISSGYLPLGATLFSEEMYEVISAPDAEGAFTHGFTYSGHPVCCAAALKNIEIIEREQICDHVRELGPYFEEQLATLRDLPIVGDVRGSHFMMCVENVADKDTKAMFPDEVNIGKRIANQCEERGLIVRPVGHLNVLSPPLTLRREQIDETVDILRKGIKAAADELVRENVRID